jgi:predicted Zn-dependent protease
MSVGVQPNSNQLDGQMTNLANSLRKLMGQIRDLNTEINSSGQGTATLETAGYDSTDAATFLQLLAYFETISGVYYGSVQAGGTGGAGAIEFDYDSALSALWGGAVQ